MTYLAVVVLGPQNYIYDCMHVQKHVTHLGVVVSRHHGEKMVLDLIVEVPCEPIVEPASLHVARSVQLLYACMWM